MRLRLAGYAAQSPQAWREGDPVTPTRSGRTDQLALAARMKRLSPNAGLTFLIAQSANGVAPELAGMSRLAVGSPAPNERRTEALGV